MWAVCVEGADCAPPVTHGTFPGNSHITPASTSPLFRHPFPRGNQHGAVHRKPLLTLSLMEAQPLNPCPWLNLGRGSPAQVKYLLAEVFNVAVKHLLVPVLLVGRKSSPALGEGSACSIPRLCVPAQPGRGSALHLELHRASASCRACPSPVIASPDLQPVPCVPSCPPILAGCPWHPFGDRRLSKDS